MGTIRTHVVVAGAGPAGLTLANLLRRNGLADRLLRSAQTQGSLEFRFDSARYEFQYAELTGNRHFVYPQQIPVTDLVAAQAAGITCGRRSLRRDIHRETRGLLVRGAEDRIDEPGEPFVKFLEPQRVHPLTTLVVLQDEASLP
jgi:cation diffusion facilitator CzcD-associated flavoprotein CzcO